VISNQGVGQFDARLTKRPHSQRRETGRHPGRTANKIRAGN
jgi:hypothetical protein